MSMTVESAPSRAFSSSSVTGTYWSLATSYPLTSSPRSTTAWSTGQYICCRIRWPHVAWSRWKATPAETAAVYSLIGTATSPNEIVPEPIEWAGITNPPRRDVYCPPTPHPPSGGRPRSPGRRCSSSCGVARLARGRGSVRRRARAGRAEVVEGQEATAPEAGGGVGGHSEGQLVVLESGNDLVAHRGASSCVGA